MSRVLHTGPYMVLRISGITYVPYLLVSLGFWSIGIRDRLTISLFPFDSAYWHCVSETLLFR
jgi:hypothetical protein